MVVGVRRAESAGAKLMAYDKADSQRRYWSKRKDHPDAKFIRSRAWRDGLRLMQLNAEPLCARGQGGGR